MSRHFLPPAALALALLTACASPVKDAAVFAAPEPIMVEPSIAETSSRSADVAIKSRPVSGSTPSNARSGVITAGDIDDTLNFRAFARYANKAQRDTKLPRISLKNPVLLQLTGPDGKPAPGTRVTLRRGDSDSPFYDGYAGVDGMVSVLPATFDVRPGTYTLRAFPPDQGQPFETTLNGGNNRKTIALPFGSDWKPAFLDLVFVVDTTGSMADELAWLTAELKSVTRAAKRKAPGVDIRYGLIVYRDQGDEYVTRNFGFTTRQSKMISWLRAQSASGGGDYPEAATRALAEASELPWRRGKGERLLFHIADAPTHSQDAKRFLDAAGKLAENNVQIFSLGASGVADEAEFLMRQASLLTAGRYAFLTDDSGVGYGHAEPTVSCYQVTSLKDLVARTLASELTGQRIEASDVIREVGTYRRGICLN